MPEATGVAVRVRSVLSAGLLIAILELHSLHDVEGRGLFASADTTGSSTASQPLSVPMRPYLVVRCSTL